MIISYNVLGYLPHVSSLPLPILAKHDNIYDGLRFEVNYISCLDNKLTSSSLYFE